jgi:hypothetical protein
MKKRLKDKITIVWSIDDVKMVWEDIYPEIAFSKTDLRKVLRDVDEAHDANFGITYDTIEYCLREYVVKHPPVVHAEDCAINLNARHACSCRK